MRSQSHHHQSNNNSCNRDRYDISDVYVMYDSKDSSKVKRDSKCEVKVRKRQKQEESGANKSSTSRILKKSKCNGTRLTSESGLQRLQGDDDDMHMHMQADTNADRESLRGTLVPVVLTASEFIAARIDDDDDDDGCRLNDDNINNDIAEFDIEEDDQSSSRSLCPHPDIELCSSSSMSSSSMSSIGSSRGDSSRGDSSRGDSIMSISDMGSQFIDRILASEGNKRGRKSLTAESTQILRRYVIKLSDE